MTTAHASLTGAELHEPKGIATATVGQVYVANGSASGAWTSIDATAFTGMVADFTTPVAPSGWLELDGSTISTTTYANLYAVQTIQQTGTRTNGSAIITSLSSTTNMKGGFYVFGTGIASGTTILTVDSPTQITLSATASSSGTNTVVVSPWLLNTGTIKLPDVTTLGRYRRSRTSSTAVGQTQADAFASHTHTGSGTTGTVSNDHTHAYSGTTSGQSIGHTHTVGGGGVAAQAGGSFLALTPTTAGPQTTSDVSADHTHTYSGNTGGISANHSHTYSFTTSSAGSTETRPLSIVFMTCVKT